jgi:hypothetical protein
VRRRSQLQRDRKISKPKIAPAHPHHRRHPPKRLDNLPNLLVRAKRIKQWTFYKRDEKRIAAVKRAFRSAW